MENGEYVDGSLWFYAPNKEAPVVWTFLFSASCLCHLYQCAHYKSWKVTGILPWAALVFVTGYVLREIGAFHYGNVNIFISSLVMLYAAPPFYELANYFILSRILYYVPYHSPIHPGRVLTTFAGLSAVVEALNGNGASRVANSSLPENKQEIGRSLLKAALVLQLAILCVFVLLASTFHRKCFKAGLLPTNLKAVLLTLYCSSGLIGIRTIYRTIEYFSSASLHITPNFNPQSLSPIIRYEWFFWVFEASLMITNSVLLNVRHPMRFLPRNNRIYLAEDGVTEVEGEGYEDSRMFLITIVDPFDVWGMIRGRNMNQKFWETHKEERPGNVVVERSAGEGIAEVEVENAEADVEKNGVQVK